MKKTFCGLLIACLLLSGCAAGNINETTVPETEVTEAATETEAPTEPETVPETDPAADALVAYEGVLTQFLEKHINAAGEVVWTDNTFGELEENQFAIADVDSDGQQELILTFSTAPMAGMCTWVYGYDAQTRSVYEKLSVFPSVTFYTGGLLQADHSHNQGRAGDALWPYALMQYDAEKRTYSVIAQVDAWDRQLGETDYDGNPFPEEADTDGTGIVYLLTLPTLEGTFETDTVSLAVYEAWRIGILGDNTPIQPEYQNTTWENIHALIPEA